MSDTPRTDFRMKITLKRLLIALLLFALFACVAYFDQWVWAQAHPGAPSWAYWFSR